MATNPLLKLIEAQNARVKDASDLVVGTTIQNVEQTDKALVGMQDALQRQVNSQAVVLQTQQLARMEAEQNASEALEIIGGKQNLFQKIVDVNVAGETLKARVGELDRLQNTTFFGDGPLDWIKARMELPYAQQRVETGVMKTQAARQAAADVNNAIQETVQTTNATQRTITQTSINAATDALKAEYDFKSNQVNLDRLRNNLIPVEAILKAAEGQLARVYSTVNQVRAEQQWGMQLERLAAEREDRAFVREERIAQRASRLEQQQFDESTRAKINLARNSRGEPPLQGAEWKSYKELAPKDELYRMVKLGEQAAATGVPLIALSPAEAAGVFTNNPGLTFEGVREESKNIIMQAVQSLQNLGQSKKIEDVNKFTELQKDRTGKLTDQFINSEVQKIISGYTANADVPKNPFHIGDLSAFIGDGTKVGSTALTNLPASQKVLIPAVKAGVKLDSFETVNRLMADAIRAKAITSSEAIAGTTAIYLQANAIHRAQMGLKAVGVRLPEDAHGYKAKVGNNIYDATDPVQVGRALTQQMFNSPDARLRARTEGPLLGLIRLGSDAFKSQQP